MQTVAMYSSQCNADADRRVSFNEPLLGALLLQIYVQEARSCAPHLLLEHKAEGYRLLLYSRCCVAPSSLWLSTGLAFAPHIRFRDTHSAYLRASPAALRALS